MSKYFDPRALEVSITDMLKYDAVKDPDGWLIKDMGDYVQVVVPMQNKYAHDTYNVYFDAAGKICRIFGHPNNSGFEGDKYYNF